MSKRFKPSEQQKQAVLEIFYGEHDNSVSTICEQVNLSSWWVNTIINNDLKRKSNVTVD